MLKSMGKVLLYCTYFCGYSVIEAVFIIK